MNICKESYKVHRDSSKEIFKGFGFAHLSDATSYYVHPNNQSFNGTTTLCQPIGEAITLTTLLFQSIECEETTFGTVYQNSSKAVVLNLAIDDEMRNAGLFSMDCVRAMVKFDREKDIEYAFLDGNNDVVSTNEYNILLMCHIGMLLYDILNDEDIHYLFETFKSKLTADAFVNLHEDYYQLHKFDDYIYKFSYCTIDASFESITERFHNIKVNKENLNIKVDIELLTFDNFDIRNIPHLSEAYQLDDKMMPIGNAVVNGDVLTVLLHGPSGTGKTFACKLLCQQMKLPIIATVNCTENLDEFILGKYLPIDDRIVFMESEVTKAIRNGGAVVFEEINFAKPGYLAFLNSLLDDNGFVRLDNGEIVRRHKNFRFFATMNIGYFGTKELNQALFNRFHAIIELSSLNTDSIKRMLLCNVPECEQHVDKILGVFHKIKTKIEKEELDIVISARNLENWAKLAKYEGYLKAAEMTIIPIAKCDRLLETTIRNILMLYKWYE